MVETRAARKRLLDRPSNAAVDATNDKGRENVINRNNQENHGENAVEGNGRKVKATTMLPNNNKRQRKAVDEEPKPKQVRIALQTVTNLQPQGKANGPTAKLDAGVKELTRAQSTWSTSGSSASSSSETCSRKDEAGRTSLQLTSSTRSTDYQFGIADDIDAKDAKDPSCVSDYVQSLYSHYRSKERCRTFYLDKRPYLTEQDRTDLVDWMIEIHHKFKLHRETLYLAVYILDEFLARAHKKLIVKEMNLVGVTAIFLAAKYEEMYIPELRDLTYICNGVFGETEILMMEETILRTLNYYLTVPTAHHFLIRFLKAAHADKFIASMSCFILDGTLLIFEKLQCRFLPSELAAAAIMIARRASRRNDWSPTLLHITKYRHEDVEPVAKAVLKAKTKLDICTREFTALEKKYSKSKYLRVADMELPSF